MDHFLLAGDVAKGRRRLWPATLEQHRAEIAATLQAYQQRPRPDLDALFD